MVNRISVTFVKQATSFAQAVLNPFNVMASKVRYQSSSISISIHKINNSGVEIHTNELTQACNMIQEIRGFTTGVLAGIPRAL